MLLDRLRDKKVVSIIMILAMVASLLSGCSVAVNESDEGFENTNSIVPVESIEKKSIPYYVNDSTDVSKQDIYFFNGNDAVAYMEVDEFFDIFSGLFEDYPDFALERDYVDNGYSVKRENGSETVFDMSDGSISLNDYDKFSLLPGAINPGDIISTPLYFYDDDNNVITDDDGQPLVHLFKRSDHGNSSRTGFSLLLALSDYDIPVYCNEGKCFLPVATLSDLFLAPNLETFLSYNEERLFLITGDELNDKDKIEDGKTFSDIFYDVSATERSEELAQFTYNELCLFLNGNYGLKDEHDIGDSFDDYFETIGLKDRLLDTDSKVFGQAMYELFVGYFADFHSGLRGPSPYMGKDTKFTLDDIGNVAKNIGISIDNTELYGNARAATDLVDEDGNPIPYMEVGNTAYITFDEFEMCPDISDYYSDDFKNDIEDYIGKDTIALVHYSNEQINRQDSPVENIVLDLSNNGGGECDCAAFVISWVLDNCSMSIENAKIGSKYSATVWADVNLDKVIDEKDSLDLGKYRFFCLTNMLSFSCGNLVPSLLYESGMVTLIGRTSGGGACVVQPGIAADGTRFCISSDDKLCTVKNGTFYPIDQGVGPDFTIGDPKHFYDRQWLTDYINTLP